MDKRNKILNIQCILLAVLVIVTAAVGLLYTNHGKQFSVTNMYGDVVTIYGRGIYAYNSVLNVANYLGANASEIIVSALLIIMTLWKSRPLWVEIIRNSEVIFLLYASMFSVFGISMNQLYLFYVICFALGLYTAFISLKRLFNLIDVPKELISKKFNGIGVFLIVAGIMIGLVWISSIIPILINGDYGSLLGIQTNEVTYGIDLSITCPMFVLCGFYILRKKEIGFKLAPIILNTLINVAILVIMQRAFCLKLGIDIPIKVLVVFIISFVILGIFALYFLIKLLMKLRLKKLVK